jgi:hypothetical protein
MITRATLIKPRGLNQIKTLCQFPTSKVGKILPKSKMANSNEEQILIHTAKDQALFNLFSKAILHSSQYKMTRGIRTREDPGLLKLPTKWDIKTIQMARTCNKLMMETPILSNYQGIEPAKINQDLMHSNKDIRI